MPLTVTSLALEARSGLPIENVIRHEMPYEVLQARIDMIVQGYPNTKAHSSSAIYNCFGLVFAGRRTWLEDPPVLDILNADGYQLLRFDAKFWKEGDLVLYFDESRVPVHVGVIWAIHRDIMNASFDVEVLSKWGESGEFVHPMNTGHDGLGFPVQVWTQRFLP